MGVVYKITCLPTGKSYVGKTTLKLSERINKHRNIRSSCRLLSNVIQEYEWDNNFEVEILWESDDNELLDSMERKLISEINTLSPNGYNMKEGGGKGEKYGEELRQIICKARKENVLKKCGILGSIRENKSKVDGSTTSWSLRVFRNGKKYTVAKCETKEEILDIQQEYTKDPDDYIIPPSKQSKKGEALGVYFNSNKKKWHVLVDKRSLGLYDTKEEAENILKKFREDPTLFDKKKVDRYDLGVIYKKNRNKWNATIWRNGKTLDLGEYCTQEEAINSRKRFIENPETFVRPNQRKKIML